MFPFSSRGNGGRPAFDFGLFSEVDAEVNAEVIAVEGGGNKWDDAEMIFEILLNGILCGCCWVVAWVWSVIWDYCCCYFKSLFKVRISCKSLWFVICSWIWSLGPECKVIVVEEDAASSTFSTAIGKVDGCWGEVKIQN